MFLRSKSRIKDGKVHRYWSVVENRRVRDGRVVQRQVLYLGEINDSQARAWRRSIEVFADGHDKPQQLTLFAEGPSAPMADDAVVQVRVGEVSVERPRQWGGCWLAQEIWDQLALDSFWRRRLPPSRQDTRWLNVFKTLVFYRLLDPGSEWRLHRHWFEVSAMGDLLGEDIGLVQIDKLYRCLDRLLVHKRDFFSHLKTRWQSLFAARFDVLLYDLTSTYFEADPAQQDGLRRFGYSRDKRSDCVQVVIALIVTPDGLPLAYEVMPGNTADNATLTDFLERIAAQYGRANRTWVMDRGIPTEDSLATMRAAAEPIHYLVGTPKGRLTRMEKAFLALPWERVRDSVEVKLLRQDGELYVLAKSAGRMSKERAMRCQRLKKLWSRLGELRQQKLTRDQLLMKVGAAKKDAGRAFALVDVE
ncbi:MAG: IS1634 family transposase [Hyphomicrobiales bacterium]|nr:IS1634 family transposase [Hyphomicrobiales bacterium]